MPGVRGGVGGVCGMGEEEMEEILGLYKMAWQSGEVGFQAVGSRTEVSRCKFQALPRVMPLSESETENRALHKLGSVKGNANAKVCS